MNNFILPFQLDNASVRGRVIRLSSVLNSILGLHDYPDALARYCAEIGLLSAVMSSLIKYEGIFTLQAQGDGPVSMLVSDMTNTGALRVCANVKQDAVLTPHPMMLSDYLGKGYISFTVDQGPDTERYQGIVELKGEGLQESLLHYFTQSEQISTGIKMAVAHGSRGWHGQAIVMQEIPRDGGQTVRLSNAEEDDWRRVMMLLQSCTDEELLDEDLGAEELLFRLFHEETVRVFEAQNIRHECRCSADKLRKMLAMMPQNDLDYMTQEEEIAMRCEFCGRHYNFTRNEIERYEKTSD